MQVLCSACTDNKAPLRYTQFQPVRVCHQCFSVLLAAHGQDPDLANKFRAGSALKRGRKVSVGRPESLMSGQLSLSLGGGRWRRSWYLLHQGAHLLHSYAGREDTQPEDSVNLLDYHTVTRPGLLTFILRPAEHQPQLHFTADSEAARDAWVEAILQSLPS